MDYGKTVCEMLTDATLSKNPEQMTEFIRCLSFGIANATAFVIDMDAQQSMLFHIFEGMKIQAKEAFVSLHGGEVSQGDYLKHVFQPEKFNG